ncbi:hypothetical protein MMC07_007355 [Pseudocyphellaria aurata]|nr:hypothetical protein [Pseudocyphellaria aurata]
MSAQAPNGCLHPSQANGRPSQDDHDYLLRLKTVLGTTTSSPNSFDCHSDIKTFAVCAGSAVIVARVDAHLNIAQQIFRARPNARPVNETPSFYNPSTPPVTTLRNRLASSFKDGGYDENVAESPAASQITKRTREATCISLSSEGTLLAVGERGKTPRILIFPATTDPTSECPLSVLTDHSFGVRSLAFSPDSRWLCSLGDLHDGFLYLWSINEKSGAGNLHASNKCQNANAIGWVGRQLISFGTRHVKVWRLGSIPPASPSKIRSEKESRIEKISVSPGPKTFYGRNCLLGPLINAVFTCLAAISDDKAILCTERGDVCLLVLDESDRAQRLDRVAQVAFSVSCVVIEKESGFVWVAGRNGRLQALSLHALSSKVSSDSPCSSAASTSRSGLPSETKPSILAMGMVQGRIVTVDSDHIIELRDIKNHDDGDTTLVHMKSIRQPAHESSVLGASILSQPNAYDSEFFTWSTNGIALFWTLSGICKGRIKIALDQSISHNVDDGNELKILRAASFGDFYISGDKEGVLRHINCRGENISTIKAHSGDINDVAIHSGASGIVLVVSCGRDRTLQLFQKAGEKLLLLQTILDHVASVNNVIFLNESSLLSSSSDRTICVRTMAFRAGQSVAFFPTRVIALKASPMTLSALPDHPNTIVFSTMDRQIHKYDVHLGRFTHSLKASDSAGGESVTLSFLSAQNIKIGDSQVRLLLGVSSTDRSIRIYNYDTGSILAKEHGQTVVSSIALVQKTGESGHTSTLVISTGLDGTVMIWDLIVRSSYLSDTGEATNRRENIDPWKSPASVRPLRRILSKSEISGFQRFLDNDGDSPTSARSKSPSQLCKKTPRFSMANSAKLAIIPHSAEHSLSSSSMANSSRRKIPRDRSPTSPSPISNVASKYKRCSLDGHRSKNNSDLNEFNTLAEQICMSLRALRKQLTSSTESVRWHTAEELERELNVTLRVLSEKTKRTQPINEIISGDLLDEYLARMIDERLALKVKSERTVNVSEGGPNAAEVLAKSGGEG